MVGAWSAALLSVLGLGRLLWKAFVRAVEVILRSELTRIWIDMQHNEDRLGIIEQRLDRLEKSLVALSDQVSQMTELLMHHVSEMTRRHDG